MAAIPSSRYNEIYVQQSQTMPLPSYQQSIVTPNSRTNEAQSTSTTNVHSNYNLGDPPTYEEAIDPDAPPPSYDSLFGRVREVHRSSKGFVDFLKNIVILLLGTLGFTVILGATTIVPICMIVFGSIYLYDCPQGEYIPVYLLVGGGFGVIKQLLHLSTRVRNREDQAEEEMRQSSTQMLLNCFMLGWFIIGSYWVYKEYEPNYDPTKGKYCNKSLYLFSFWLVTSIYITTGLVLFILCFISVASVIAKRHT
ncbi:transmembrane protein 272-like [Phlebotomus papatasi]|uniref:transmembrane protein 272-like n=1 Tax=Phlebotomus papatasi TaxID=29031 RepID=UPI0024837319|nr:transmembrane protein 272-like [Phlebotomus papatasi]XP_055706240.1 transmembrane protein 272-like [Phlebotomus papatasi]XP_055706241.1 transmembrane protein 272-like [Phlebotomus papatasi]XP_055706242.1 transmembrane protein 272-like [Phlebotomus papatasi]XP_055706243.1 transmembrane protein 272-like [Phlebotomus papatasi]